MEVFAIAPATSRAVWLIILIPVVIGVLGGGVLVAAATGARSSRFEVSAEGLRLRGDMYGRLVPADQILGGSARRVDFTVTPQLRPGIRTVGTGLPGYRAGWFRLRNGEKALVYLTDFSRAVYVPTTAGYSVLVSPSDPDRFLTAIAAVNPSRTANP